MEQPVPAWLDREFLTQCLQKEYGENHIVVKNLSATPAVPPGNNYGSCIHRVKAEYKLNKDDNKFHSLSLIVKSELPVGPMKEMVDAMEVVEPIFYNKYLPLANKFTSEPFTAKKFFSMKSSVIVLEDLKEEGYVMVDRLTQLDFEHCRQYCIAAASFHAVSFAVHKEHPELIESMGKEKMFDNNSPLGKSFKKLMNVAFKVLSDNIKKIDKFSKHSKIIKDFSGSLWDMTVEAVRQSKVLNTLNQGDPWTTNMMFKYDANGKVIHVKLLDFQGLRYGSPVNDLVFFIWSSTNHDVRTNRLGDVYKIYLDTFNNKLAELHCKERFNSDHFNDNIVLLNSLALFMVALHPFMVSEDPVDYGAIFQYDDVGIENTFKQHYNESYCKNHLPKLLEQLELARIFDYLKNYRK